MAKTARQTVRSVISREPVKRKQPLFEKSGAKTFLKLGRWR